MQREQWHETIPANAGVVIDYDKPPKDKVKFYYPKKWTWGKATLAITFPTNFFYWLEIGVYSFIVYAATFIAGIVTQQFIANPGYWISQMWAKSQTLGPIGATPPPPPITLQSIMIVMPIAVLLLCFFIIPVLSTIYFYFRKEETAKWLPRMNYDIARNFYILLKLRHKTVTFTSKDITEGFIAIPEFHNVYLDYKATADFAEKLQKVEVREYPYNYKYEGSRRKEINQRIWRALFLFKENPTSGTLKVRYM